MAISDTFGSRCRDTPSDRKGHTDPQDRRRGLSFLTNEVRLVNGTSIDALPHEWANRGHRLIARGASHFGWHAQAVGAGMFTKSAFSMAALRLAMASHAGIATFFGMHPIARTLWFGT